MRARDRHGDGHAPARGYRGSYGPDYLMVAPLPAPAGNEHFSRAQAARGGAQAHFRNNDQHAIHIQQHQGVPAHSPVPWQQAQWGQAHAGGHAGFNSYSPYHQQQQMVSPTMHYQYGAQSGVFGSGYAAQASTEPAYGQLQRTASQGYLAPTPPSRPRPASAGAQASVRNFSRTGSGMRYQSRLRAVEDDGEEQEEEEEEDREGHDGPRDRDGRMIQPLAEEQARTTTARTTARPASASAGATHAGGGSGDEPDEDEDAPEGGGGAHGDPMMKLLQKMMISVSQGNAELMERLVDKVSEKSSASGKTTCPLSSEEIKSLQGDLQPKNILAWWAEFVAGVEGRIKGLEDILDMPQTEVMPGGPCWSEIQDDEELRKIDLLLAQTIKPCLKKGAGNV
jgi:hypothetical protein